MPVGGATLWITAGKDDAETAATWDFLKYMTSAQAQSTWAAATGYVPVNTGAPDLEPLKSVYTSDPRFTVAYEQLTGGEDTVNAAGPVLGPQRQVRQVTAEAVRAVLGGANALSELEAAAKKANDLLAEYNDRVG
jgi:sn-glycerol 3-phosphate transport system substrate-binding protein